jgi:hypothetical protein
LFHVEHKTAGERSGGKLAECAGGKWLENVSADRMFEEAGRGNVPRGTKPSSRECSTGTKIVIHMRQRTMVGAMPTIIGCIPLKIRDF